ncbi:MAG TPA: hypothetical protein VM261_31945 [Kofleriaceae bacterium]|nr:hypothetical protein [Kofleriaceae bacterium]
MLDVFVAPLRCPACGADAPEAEIQTYIRGASADGSAMRVGFELDAVDLATDAILNAGYVLVQEPDVGGPVRLLDVWICPSCQTEPWAMIEIVDRRVREIAAVTLDRPTLMAVHFISETNADILADSLRGDLDAGLGSVEILKRRLPA